MEGSERWRCGGEVGRLVERNSGASSVWRAVVQKNLRAETLIQRFLNRSEAVENHNIIEIEGVIDNNKTTLFFFIS